MVLVAYVSCLLPAPVYATTATATVKAEVAGGISATVGSGLSFGTFSPGTTPGTVSVDATGFRTSAGGVTLSEKGLARAALFQVAGTPNSTFAITLPALIVVSSLSGDSMIVNHFKSDPVGSGLLNTGGSQNVTVGGTLNVKSNQNSGSYWGVLIISIVYN